MVSHKLTKQLFALKTFRRYHGQQFENVRRAFKNEVSIMERLSSHIHIIQVWGTYICDRELGILLSPVANGGDLGAYLARVFESGMTSEHEIILNRAFGCLTNGLAYIHKLTIRHKDIKPQNILIHDGRVIYTDFGISFDADQQDTTTIGYPGAFTRRYCAPEVQDWAERNRKSDVYSLGCVFVEILDALEPKIGFRCMDRLPYFEKLDEVRRRLVQHSATGKARKELLRICHDMLEPSQVDRIDTGSVLRRIARLGSPEDKPGVGLFCGDCSAIIECKDITTQEELVDGFTVPSLNANPDGDIVLSLNVNPNTDTISPEAGIESTATKAAEERNNKKRVPSIEFGEENRLTVSPRAFHSQTSRYYCTTCGELGHSSSKCSNKCWACGELYHKSADCPNKCWDCDSVGHYARNCPNKCWTCDQVGHQAKNCPNECDACGKIGHPADNCPNRCWTCSGVGHFARDCQDKCFVCGKIGHWKRDCDDACFECEFRCYLEATMLTIGIHRW
jgi:serine/threonine protein kinase